MKTRTGKIARLPHPIRQQLNQQLHDGASGKKIISWLNALPEVNAILTEQFASHPISENNLSKWRRGGYQDWLHERQTQTQTLQFARECLRMEPEDRLRHIESLIVAEFANTIEALRDIPDAEIRIRRMQGLSREFVRMQKLHTHGLQLQLHQEKLHSTPHSKLCQAPDTL